jgi:hypothetical protein
MLIKNVSSQTINEDFYYCQHNEITRLLDTSPKCTHPNENVIGLLTDIIDPSINFPSKIRIASKNRYYLKGTGNQCYAQKITTYNNMSWYFGSTHESKIENGGALKIRMPNDD